MLASPFSHVRFLLYFGAAISPSSNPFAAALPAPSNPFQTNKPSPPTMNQLRAQSSQVVGGGAPLTNYSNASALSSLFNSPSNSSPLPVTAAVPIPGSHPTTLAIAGGSAWPGFSNGGQPQPVAPFGATSPSQNNPFAM